MAKNKPYGWTLLDQAESLYAAGLDPNTADMNFSAGTLVAVPFKETFFTDKKPCWSVGRLLSLMPRLGRCVGNLYSDDGFIVSIWTRKAQATRTSSASVPMTP